MLFIARRQSNHVLRKAGHFVHLLFDRQAGAQVVKLHGAGGFGENREGEGIPFGKDLAVGDVFAVLTAEARTVNHVVALLLAVLFIDDGDQSSAVHGDGGAATTLDMLEVDELDDAVVARFERERSETRVAVPPMWKVRMVSCVPGSPMDCAAMTPTASPSSTMRPVARLRP